MKRAIVLAAICMASIAGCHKTDSTSLMPGQSLVIQNRSIQHLHFVTEYPVSISGEQCQIERTVDETVNCGPSNITVTDLRPRLLIWGHSNTVSWTYDLLPLQPSEKPSPQTLRSPTSQPERPIAPQSPMPEAITTKPSASENAAANSVKPKEKNLSLRLLPGEAIKLPNTEFRKVLVRSEYPISVVVGNCHNQETVQWLCSIDPAEIFIADIRRKPLFMTPKANVVSVNEREF